LGGTGASADSSLMASYDGSLSDGLLKPQRPPTRIYWSKNEDPQMAEVKNNSASDLSTLDFTVA
jgi:hypothetical protein